MPPSGHSLTILSGFVTGLRAFAVSYAGTWEESGASSW